ncbi:MAG TPA: ATP-dependent helicase, partial [Myxococcaceae bacterium]|nr:ATP-dependent helicase [Myxococcaceae bacterium]
LRTPAPISVAHAQERALAAARESLLREVERRNQLELDRLREQADRYAEDCLLEPREALAKARASWEEARARLSGLEDATERARARAAVQRAERDHRKRLAALRNEEETRYGLKDRTLAELATRAKVVDRRALVGTAYLWLS